MCARWIAVVILVTLTAATAFAMEAPGRLGPGTGTLQPDRSGDPCGELRHRTDGPYETGYNWEYGGVTPPDDGALAECYSGPAEVCGVSVDLTCSGVFGEGTFNIFLWDDDGGMPGSIVSMRLLLSAGTVGFWPSVTRCYFSFNAPTCMDGNWWVGWGIVNWADLWVGADLDGPLGCPMTNVPAGEGYPTGWHSVDVVWGPTNSIGIGAQVNPCLPVPTRRSSWGSVKTLYR